MNKSLILLSLIGAVIFVLVSSNRGVRFLSDDLVSAWTEKIREFTEKSPENTEIAGSVAPKDINWYTWVEQGQNNLWHNVYLSIDADSRKLEGSGISWQRPHLVVRCLRGTLSIYVVWDLEVGKKLDDARISYQIDEGPKRYAQWRLSENHRATGLWRNQGLALVKSLENADAFSVRLKTSTLSEPKVARFNVSEMKNKLPPLWQSCTRTPRPRMSSVH